MSRRPRVRALRRAASRWGAHLSPSPVELVAALEVPPATTALGWFRRDGNVTMGPAAVELVRRHLTAFDVLHVETSLVRYVAIYDAASDAVDVSLIDRWAYRIVGWSLSLGSTWVVGLELHDGTRLRIPLSEPLARRASAALWASPSLASGVTFDGGAQWELQP